MMSERLVDQNLQSEDADAAMRPKTLQDFVGQQKGRENLAIFIEAAKSAVMRSTMFCWPARRGWAKRLWRKLWRANWAPDFVPLRGR